MVQIESDSHENNCKLERKTAKYADQTDRFTKEGDNYLKQFHNLYIKRLEELSPIVKENLLIKWGEYKLVRNLIYLMNSANDK